MSQVPEKAIEAVCRSENLQVSQRENAETVLRAALPALYESWEAEAVKRIAAVTKGHRESDPRYWTGFADGKIAAQVAIRAIRGEPGDG